MSGNACDCGRPSEILQAEHLAQWNIVPADRNQPPAPPAASGPIAGDLPAPPVAPKVEEKKLDPAEFDKTGKLPLEALPKAELVKLAEANSITLDKDAKREDVVSLLKAKGIVDVTVQK